MPDEPGVLRYATGLGRDGERLDVALAELTGLSRRRVRSRIEDGQVWVNGRPVRVLSRAVAFADVLDFIPEAHDTPRQPSPPRQLPLLHDDGWLVAVDKPFGMASQAPRRRGADELSVVEALTLQLAHREGRRVELLLFHRLDRITTGVLLFPRHHEAASALTREWRGGEVVKHYLAVVCGDPGPGERELAGAIAADPLVPGRFVVDRRGRPAHTTMRRIATSEGFSLVELRPRTGRTHQVRVHLAEAGWPVAGDSLYGGHGPSRPLLHAWQLGLPHPRNRHPLRIVAPLPPALVAFAARVGLAAELATLTGAPGRS